MRAALGLIAALTLSGCFTARYLTQAAAGEIDLLRRAEPIEKIAFDPHTSERLAQLLLSVEKVKHFGVTQGLKATGNYQRYTELKRPVCVWVVSACQSLSFTSKRWHFPISGSVPYLGWFDRKAALAFADELKQDASLDVDVRGASAFSTLGWFRDPVLSTMIGEGDEALGELANVVLHESVHATVYVPDQSAFNESLASFVADRLTQQWLDQRHGAQAPQTTAWRAAQQSSQGRVRRLHQAYVALDAVYRSAASDAEKLQRKASVLSELSTELGAKRPLNNATLVSYQTYDTSGPAFERLLTACDGSIARLLGAVRTLTAIDFQSRSQDDLEPVLGALAARGCR